MLIARIALTFFVAFSAFAEAPEEGAVVVPTSTLRYSQHQESCERIAAYSSVCGTLGLDKEQKSKALNLVKLLPETTFINGCDYDRKVLKKCLEKTN